MKIALLGDIAFFGKYSCDHIDYEECFGEIKEVLSTCDYVIGNLETPLTDEKKTIGGKSAYIKGSPADVSVLKRLGVTHISLANNHSYDYRRKGLTDTINVLDENGIKWFGVDGKTEEILSLETKIKLRGYCCYSTNGKGLSGKSDGVNELDAYAMEKDLISDKNSGFITLASCHWGQEHVHYPNYDHVVLARKLSKNNTTVFYGHHPHVIQGIEEKNGSLIAYSLGNFCFDDVYTSKSKEPLIRLSQDNQESFVLIIDFTDNKIAEYTIIPFSFKLGKHIIDDSIKDKITEWSDFLSKDPAEYKEKRSADFKKYIDSRKKKRDFEWYLNRMNVESVKMIIASRNNIKHYISKVGSFVSGD